MPARRAWKLNDSEKKSNLVFLPTPGFTSKSESGWGQTKPQRLLCVCSSLAKYKNMLCWLIRTASPVTHLKGFEIMSLHVFSLKHPIIQKNCFLICVFHVVRPLLFVSSQRAYQAWKRKGHPSGTNLSDKDVQSPFAEKEKESISKLCEPSNEEASGWWALERGAFPIFCILQELTLLLLLFSR